MSDADTGTMIETLRRHFPALAWRWEVYLTRAEGNRLDTTLLADTTIRVEHREGKGYRAEVRRFTVAVGFRADTLHRLIIDIQRHLRRVAVFHMRAAGGVAGDTSAPWMRELDAIDNEDNREVRIAMQEAIACHIADLEAEVERLTQRTPDR